MSPRLLYLLLHRGRPATVQDYCDSNRALWRGLLTREFRELYVRAAVLDDYCDYDENAGRPLDSWGEDE